MSMKIIASVPESTPSHAFCFANVLPRNCSAPALDEPNSLCGKHIFHDAESIHRSPRYNLDQALMVESIVADKAGL